MKVRYDIWRIICSAFIVLLIQACSYHTVASDINPSFWKHYNRVDNLDLRNLITSDVIQNNWEVNFQCLRDAISKEALCEFVKDFWILNCILAPALGILFSTAVNERKFYYLVVVFFISRFNLSSRWLLLQPCNWCCFLQKFSWSTRCIILFLFFLLISISS